jgi:hypothetical protein
MVGRRRREHGGQFIRTQGSFFQILNVGKM